MTRCLTTGEEKKHLKAACSAASTSTGGVQWQRCVVLSEPGQGVGGIPPDLDRSVKPISTGVGMGQIMPTTLFVPPRIFGPSYGPVAELVVLPHR